MDCAKKKNIHIVITGIASSFLLIYSMIRIVITLSKFFVNVSYLNYLVLALCGFVLIYFAHFLKDETSVPKPAGRAKVVIFSLLLGLSVISVIRVVYFTVISSGADIGIMNNIVYFAIGLFTFTGVALFAVVTLGKIWNNSFRNAVVAVCIAGTAGGLLINTISFTNMMINYVGIRGQFEMFGITQSMVFTSIWKYFLQLAIDAATLTIIIFRLKIAEQQNSSILGRDQ